MSFNWSLGIMLLAALTIFPFQGHGKDTVCGTAKLKLSGADRNGAFNWLKCYLHDETLLDDMKEYPNQTGVIKVCKAYERDATARGKRTAQAVQVVNALQSPSGCPSSDQDFPGRSPERLKLLGLQPLAKFIVDFTGYAEDWNSKACEHKFIIGAKIMGTKENPLENVSLSPGLQQDIIKSCSAETQKDFLEDHKVLVAQFKVVSKELKKNIDTYQRDCSFWKKSKRKSLLRKYLNDYGQYLKAYGEKISNGYFKKICKEFEDAKDEESLTALARLLNPSAKFQWVPEAESTQAIEIHKAPDKTGK